MIHIDGYNIYRTDRANKGGGVAIYAKVTLNCSCVESISKPKCFELSVIKLHLPNGADLTVVGCYRPPSASHEAVGLLSDFLHKFSDKEYVLLGDLNWDWLSTTSNSLKDICDTLNLSQLINSPTRLNSKNMDKSTLLDVILTNSPHKYSAVGIFSNDVSDHCTVACVRNCKLPKTKPRFIFKRNYKYLNEQPFAHDLYNSDLDLVCVMADVDLAWNYFKTTFLALINKHAPLRRFRVGGKDNPWFNHLIFY